MKKLTVDILCQGDYMDSYESRIYFSGGADSIEESFKWAQKQLPEIEDLDECHGNTFYLYIAGQFVATINKVDKNIEIDEHAVKMLILYLTDEDAYFKALEKKLKEFTASLPL